MDKKYLNVTLLSRSGLNMLAGKITIQHWPVSCNGVFAFQGHVNANYEVPPVGVNKSKHQLSAQSSSGNETYETRKN